MLKTIVISDLHLGIPDAQPYKLLSFLKKNPCRTLIINWDLVDEKYIRLLWVWKEEYTSIINELKSICKKNTTKIIYLQWNHELSLHEKSALKNFEIQKDILYISNKKKYYIFHGHQLDKINIKSGLLAHIAFYIGTFLYTLNRTNNRIRAILWLKKKSLITWLKQFRKQFLFGKNTFYKKIHDKAIEKKCDGIICAHFHEAENCTIGKIHYLNSGERIEHCSALVEDEKWTWKVVYPKGNLNI